MSIPTERDQLVFLGNVQRLLSEGQVVATYKYALLLALADIAIELGDDSGDSLVICTSHIAEKFIRYYWQQTAPYPVKSGPDQSLPGLILRQNTGKQAAIINYISSCRPHYPTLVDLRRDARAWNRLVTQVERVVRVMPLWKLQTVGGESLDFLYANTQSRRSIQLKPGAAFCLRRFYLLINDLVRGSWLRYVRENNQHILATAGDLSEFLFGSERSSLAVIRSVLCESQSGRCFYCDRPLSGVAHVDHFIPWSRYQIDLGHNFVLAHCSCNMKKGDKLACSEHLARWVRRNHGQHAQLAEAFDRKNIVHDLVASERVAAWAYSQAASVHALAWIRENQLVPVEPRWLEVLHG